MSRVCDKRGRRQKCAGWLADKKSWSELNSLRFKVLSVNSRTGADNLTKLNSVGVHLRLQPLADVPVYP